MSKFSLSRQPYYVLVVAFMALSAVTSYLANHGATGQEALIYLGINLGQVLVGVWAGYYLLLTSAGDDDEVAARVAGFSLGKDLFYAAVIAAALYRLAIGVELNLTATDSNSDWGYAWVVASVVVIAFSVGSFRALKKEQTVAPPAVSAASAPRPFRDAA